MLISKLCNEKTCLLGGFPQLHFMFSMTWIKTVKFTPGDQTDRNQPTLFKSLTCNLVLYTGTSWTQWSSSFLSHLTFIESKLTGSLSFHSIMDYLEKHFLLVTTGITKAGLGNKSRRIWFIIIKKCCWECKIKLFLRGNWTLLSTVCKLVKTSPYIHLVIILAWVKVAVK